MPDHLDGPDHFDGPDPTFESLRQPLDVAPPDPRDIRRRAQRRSRRTAVASVAGAVLAVTAVVVPVVALTGGDEKSAPPPAVTPTPTPTADGIGWRLTVPEEFPLSDGLPMPGEGVAAVRHGEGTTLRACDADVWTADRPSPWVDVATATNADVVDPADGTDTRTLAVYPDETVARKVQAGLAQELDACSARRTGQVSRVADSDAWALPADAAASPTGELVSVVRVGNAVLVQRDGLSAGVDGAEEQLGNVRTGQQALVAAMCVFAADACPDATPPSSTEPAVAPVEEIPATFPLDVAYDDPGSDGEVSTPSRDGARVVFDPCGAEAFDRPEQDRLAFQVTYPEGADTRELRTYPSADDAVAQLQRLRDAVAACPRQDSAEPGGAAVWSTRSVDTGYDSFAAAMTYEQGLGGGLWLFTRVGRSVLAVSVGGEYAPETVWDGLPPVQDRTAKIVPSLCRFTEAGC